MVHLRHALLFAWISSAFAPFAIASDPIDLSPSKLQQEVRSILSNRCFACHGPDEAKVEAGLRLDDRGKSTSVLESGLIAIVPGQPDKSELLKRILSKDESERMPPPKFGERLSPRETQLLRDWIEKGATLPTHWSFSAPVRSAIPESEETESSPWSLNPIDRFALAKMKDHGFHPSATADSITLLRRVSLDLTGLPPSIEELDAIAADRSPSAYEDAVDRLLASPRFGEHWARKWLDLARYADSAGYADDPPRTIWAYRDWVIQALNRDIPFDQFTKEQLAGDLLPNPSQDQLIATAFHRNTLTNNEGGTNDEEFRNVAVVDRVNTTMAVWMGMTMACAQCHNHKYDPISQKDYFQLFAIFNQSQDADRRDESPTIDLLTEEQVRERKAIQEELGTLKGKLATLDPSLLQEQKKWEGMILEPTRWFDAKPTQLMTTSGDPIELAPGGTIRVQSKADRDTLEILLPLDKDILPSSLSAIQIESIPNSDLPGGGAGAANGNFVLSKVAANLIKGNDQKALARFVRVELAGESKILSLAEVEVFAGDKNVATSGKATQSSTDFGGEAGRAIDGKKSGVYTENSTTHTAESKSPWWEVDLIENRPVTKVVLHNRTDESVFQRLDGAKISVLGENREELWSTTMKKATKKPFEREVLNQPSIEFAAAYADYEQPGFAPSGVLDQNAETGWAVGGSLTTQHGLTLVAKSRGAATLDSDESPWLLRLQIECNSKHSKHVLASFRIRLTSDSNVGSKLGLPKEMLAIVKGDIDARSPDDRKKLALYFQTNVAPSFQSTRDQIATLEKKLGSSKPATSVPIMRDLAQDKLRRSFIHIRGNSRSEGEVVQPALPSAFHPLKSSSSSAQESKSETIDRLKLAEWILQQDNPLTSRVIVNRFWESIFGLGLVRSSEDFGSQGDRPSHPELLDWLSTELIRQQWNTKAMLRLIVTSATYRQQSIVTPELWEGDQDNVYLSRGPRIRLTAEQIRDQALAASGLLSHKMYGEPVRPKQPNTGLKAAFGSATDWETSNGENSFRRGMYTVWRRSNPYPSMATFDAPNREVCTLRRDRTNTPLQALVTLNDPVFIEAAQALSRRVLLIEGAKQSTQDQLRLAFRLATSRQPNDRELSALEQLLQRSLEEFKEDPSRAKKMAFDPIGPLSKQFQSQVSPEPEVEASTLAAWTVVSNVLLNLDEVLMTK